ncbi:unnamed protein product [Lepeophtheirus salmonis]|uniref:(salmon louse) hypothetical protein n=1 Tax=Lepeophtheirus salmonis TaxID=72036 RepID=A0A7R8CCP2_LEPSM|nr:unnamed protein product [Lepeophtheirus salmonis]CAF2773201.1 unnamed protein product [Lepeophtheirus salmonis]
MSRGMDCNLDMKLNQSYSACPDEFGNASFLSSPTRMELLMTRVQTLVQQSNELSKNEMEMLKALRATLLYSVEEMISAIEAEITKNQDLRYEDELQGFSSELQLFIQDIDTKLTNRFSNKVGGNIRFFLLKCLYGFPMVVSNEMKETAVPSFTLIVISVSDSGTMDVVRKESAEEYAAINL